MTNPMTIDPRYFEDALDTGLSPFRPKDGPMLDHPTPLRRHRFAQRVAAFLRELPEDTSLVEVIELLADYEPAMESL